MASQTVMNLCSSFTPKLAAFNSPAPTLLPLPPPRSFSCSSSLPKPHLNANFGGIRVLQKSRDFKCYASPKDVLWLDIPNAKENEDVKNLALDAVKDHNANNRNQLELKQIEGAQSEVVAEGRAAPGINYRLWFKVVEGEGRREKLYLTTVFVSPYAVSRKTTTSPLIG